jgi:uncharacterized membrane-anchored protein
MVLHTLIHALAPWQSAYSDSKVISTGITTTHLAALFFGGGLAIAADRSTLRINATHDGERAHQLRELRAVHRPVLIALAVLFATGVLIAAADLETYFASPVFWVKLGLVALLVANGAVLARTESRLRALASTGEAEPSRLDTLWRRLRVSAIASLALWTATLVAGALLVNAG